MSLLQCLAVTLRMATVVFVAFLGISSTSSAAQLNGTVELGGACTKVTLLEATTKRPRVVDQTRTNRDGAFELHSPHGETDSVFFVTADVGWGLNWLPSWGRNCPQRRPSMN